MIFRKGNTVKKKTQIDCLAGALNNLLDAIESKENLEQAQTLARSVLTTTGRPRPVAYKGFGGLVKTGLHESMYVGDRLSPQQAAGVPASVPDWAIGLYQTLAQPWPSNKTTIGSDFGSTDIEHLICVCHSERNYPKALKLCPLHKCTCPAGRPDVIEPGCPQHG
jgi:hypothetical protein